MRRQYILSGGLTITCIEAERARARAVPLGYTILQGAKAHMYALHHVIIRVEARSFHQLVEFSTVRYTV